MKPHGSEFLSQARTGDALPGHYVKTRSMPGTYNDVARPIQVFVSFPGQRCIAIMGTQVPVRIKYRILLNDKQAGFSLIERVKSPRSPLNQVIDMTQFHSIRGYYVRRIIFLCKVASQDD
jgi:hypothetical protein